MAAGQNNLEHALIGNCGDPDCEIHYPLVIEDENSRLTALAWFIAGGERMVESMQEQFVEIIGNRDSRLEFLRDSDDEARL